MQVYKMDICGINSSNSFISTSALTQSLGVESEFAIVCQALPGEECGGIEKSFVNASVDQK